MSELHWTGAAVLLALAVLGSGRGRPRRPEILSWADCAREHSFGAAPQPVHVEPARPVALRAGSTAVARNRAGARPAPTTGGAGRQAPTEGRTRP